MNDFIEELQKSCNLTAEQVQQLIPRVTNFVVACSMDTELLHEVINKTLEYNNVNLTVVKLV